MHGLNACGIKTACCSSGSESELGSPKNACMPEVYPEHFRNEYRKVEQRLNIFSAEGISRKEIKNLEEKNKELTQQIRFLTQRLETLEAREQSKVKVAGVKRIEPKGPPEHHLMVDIDDEELVKKFKEFLKKEGLTP